MEFYKVKRAEIGIDLATGDATVNIENVARFNEEGTCDDYISELNTFLKKNKVIGIKYYKKIVQCDDDCDIYTPESDEEEIEKDE